MNLLKKALFATLLIALTGCGITEQKNSDSKRTGVLTLADYDRTYDSAKLVTWEVGPVVGIDRLNRVRIRFVDRAGKPVVAESCIIWPYMSVHGHGGEGTVKLEGVSANRSEWIFSGFSFTMSGQWELEIRAKINDESFALSIPLKL